MLRKLGRQYSDIIKARRETLHSRLSEAGNDRAMTPSERETLTRLLHEIRAQQVTLRLQEAEGKTLLDRRKNSKSAADKAAKEIAQIEDRLAVLSAQQETLEKERNRVISEIRSSATQTVEQREIEDEIAQLEDTAHKIGAELEALNIELSAPHRVRLLDQAEPSQPRTSPRQ
jgi:chromosome segregation ATPase